MKHIVISKGGNVKFPCKDCIVLASCVGILSDKYVFKDNAYSVIVTYLASRCELLVNYIRPYDHFDYELRHREIARDFYVEKIGRDMS